MDGREKLGENQLILIDCGARVNFYNSDITRTIPVNGKFTTKQKEIYNIVLQAQMNVFSKVDIGVSWQDCHIEAEKTIIAGMQDLGIISKTIGNFLLAALSDLNISVMNININLNNHIIYLIKQN